ncbi:MAG: MarR family transcriptional regulator [Gemmatimonadota bacterium]|jgi:MarR family 2-MHQ and catechol resistance regulon transcriptional repressor
MSDDRGRGEPGAGLDPDLPADRDWSPQTERALRLWIVLARSYSTFARAVAGKVQEYGLTTPQFGVLEALHHLGPLSLGELADKLLVTGGNVTYVMDRLEEQGLAYRERSPSDRRIIQAKLTHEGKALIARVFPEHGAYIEKLAGNLSVEEQDVARTLLKKLGRAIMNDELP